jgi:cell division protein FtsL
MKIILILVILITSLMIYQNYQQRLIIDDLYQIVESHNEALILQHSMMRGMAQSHGKAVDMLEVIQGKLIWEMEW